VAVSPGAGKTPAVFVVIANRCLKLSGCVLARCGTAIEQALRTPRLRLRG